MTNKQETPQNIVRLSEVIRKIEGAFAVRDTEDHLEIHATNVALANTKGAIYETIAKNFIEKFYSYTNFGKRSLPDRENGTVVDFVYPLNGPPQHAFWVVHLDEKEIGERLQRGNTPKKLQQDIGELLLVKKFLPEVKTTVMIFDPKNFCKYAEKVYSFVWDSVIIFEDAEINAEIIRVLTDVFGKGKKIGKKERDVIKQKLKVFSFKYRTGKIEKTVKEIAHKMFQKEQNSTVSFPRHTRFESLPAIGGYSFEYSIKKPTSIVFNLLQNSDWENNPTIDLEILKFYKNFYKLPISEPLSLEKVLKIKGITLDELLKSIKMSFNLLPDNYLLKKDYVRFLKGDVEWERVINHLRYSKSWDLFNPFECLIKIKLENSGIKVQWNGPSGDIPVESVLDDLNLGMRIEEDFKVVGKNIVLQAKTLSTRVAGRKMAGYDAKRMSARAFFTRWKVVASNIQSRNIHHLAILDGSWIGPQKNPSKIFDFMYLVGGYKRIFLADEWDSLINMIESLS